MEEGSSCSSTAAVGVQTGVWARCERDEGGSQGESARISGGEVLCEWEKRRNGCASRL
jgi:hypothetical protein